VENGDITAGRLITIKSQLKHFLSFKVPDLKLAELERDSYYDYAAAGKQKHPSVRNVPLRNEESTINHMMGFAYREGLGHIAKLNFRPLKVDMKEEVKRRDIFTLKEYDHLVSFNRSYTSKKVCPDETERLERLLIRDCVLISSNTLCRPGELRQLCWGDIEVIHEAKDNKGKIIKLAIINIRAETAKNRKERTIVSRGGQYIERLKYR
jgi:integrase